MERRQLGNSKIDATVITFGAWAIGGAMWGGCNDQDAIAAIRTSIEAGVNCIDTAPIYGFGKSEGLVAAAVAGQRDKVRIFTKFGLRWDKEDGEYFFDGEKDGKAVKIFKNARKASIIEECEDSLCRLKTDYIDLYQCHWRDRTTPVEETAEALAQLIKEGKILAAGVSNFTASEIEAASKIVPIASDQPPYSMVIRDIEKELLPYCREHNVGVIVYSPLQRGLLTGKFRADHKFAAGDHRAQQPHFQPEFIKRTNEFLDKLKPFAQNHKATIGQLVLAWTISQPGITAALVGARNAEQSRENAHAGTIKLSDAEVKEITALLNAFHYQSAAR